jgi:hypothetical protein
MTARKFRTLKDNEIGKKHKNKGFKLNFLSQIRKRLLLNYSKSSWNMTNVLLQSVYKK